MLTALAWLFRAGAGPARRGDQTQADLDTSNDPLLGGLLNEQATPVPTSPIDTPFVPPARLGWVAKQAHNTKAGAWP